LEVTVMMTHCLRPIVLGGVLLMTAACASEDRNTWSSHPTHFASGKHWGFSTRTMGATRVKVTPEDVAAAQKEQWWGRGVTGMLAGSGDSTPPTAVAGLWSGGWIGRGLSTERVGPLQAEFDVNSDGYGRGRLALRDTEAVEGVPWSVRQAGSMGVPVWVKVDGNTVMLSEAHKPGSFEIRFTAEFVAEGDRLVGGFRRVNGEFRQRIPLVRMTLVRQP
jgi:hypothetical protein